MDFRAQDRSQLQSVETAVALAVGIGVFVAVLVGAALIAPALGIGRWLGPAELFGGGAGLAAITWRLVRLKRSGL
jgi:hypothetical protein